MSFLLDLFAHYFQSLHGTASADLPDWDPPIEEPQKILVDLQSYSEVYRPSYEDELYVYETTVLGRSYGEMEAKLDQLETRFTFPSPIQIVEPPAAPLSQPPPNPEEEEAQEKEAFQDLYKKLARLDALLMKDILRLEKSAAALRA